MRRLCLALLLIAPLSAADEIDVITLKGGRVVEGIYDPGSGNIEIMIGKMKGSLHIDSKDIVKHEKRAAPRVATAAPAAAADPPADPAKRQAAIQAQLKAKLRADINQTKDYKAHAERNVATMEQQQQMLPDRIRAVETQLTSAKSDLRSAESRLISVQQDRDYWDRWHNYYGWDSSHRNDRGRAAADAEGAKRRAQAEVTKIQRERDKLVADQNRIARDLPQTRIRITEYTQKLTDLESQLAQAEGAPAAGAPAAGDSAAPAPAPAPAKPGSDGLSDIPTGN